MDQRALLVRLEMPFAEYLDDIAVRDILVAGLSWPAPSGYWQGLAIDWIEQGAEADAEVIALLDLISARAHLPQAIRHKAGAAARRWRSAHARKS